MTEVFLGIIAVAVLVMAIIQVAAIVFAARAARRMGEAMARLDEQLDVLLADIGGDADHRAILDRFMLGRDMLDLPGRDVLPAAAHAVGHAAVEI